MVRAGEKAPDFSLTSLDGAKRSLPGLLEAGGLVLAFFKMACPTCQLAFPFLGRAVKAGTRIIGVSQDSAELTQLFEAKFHAGVEYLLDRAQDGYPASNAFGIHHVPALFVLSEGGRVMEVIEGFDKEAFESLGVEFTEADRVPVYKPG